MIAEQRQAAILAEINSTGGARITEIGHRLGVSGVTARRDVEALARRGLIGRVRGGGIALDPGFGPPVRRLPEKLAVARSAARAVQPADVVGLLAGTTTGLLAQQLLRVRGLTVVTNSIPIANEFHRASAADRTVILIGGVRTPMDALVGPLAQHAAAVINLDVLFVGVSGMSVDAGFTVSGRAEARTVAALWRAARRVVVLADHTKWGVTGAATIAPLAAADVLVTDAGMTEAVRREVRGQVSDLIIAET